MFTSIQIFDGEAPQDVLRLFFDWAVQSKIAFKSLDPFELHTLGTQRFLRFKVDCVWTPKLLASAKLTNRAFIYQEGSEYRLYRSAETQTGKVPLSLMCGVKRITCAAYQGTAYKTWQRQFTSGV